MTQCASWFVAKRDAGMTLRSRFKQQVLLQPLLVRIGPFESVDLAKAEPHRVIFSASFFQRCLRMA